MSLTLQRVSGGTKPGDLPGPSTTGSDVSILQTAYNALTTGTDPDFRGGGVLFIDKLYYCSKPLRMNRKNIALRGLGGSGASRKETGEADNYAYSAAWSRRPGAAPQAASSSRTGM